MESDAMDDLERELSSALRRVEAPSSLKKGLMERRRFQRQPRSRVIWERLAASLLVAALAGGGVFWRHHVEEQRKGEEARRQVLEALRITNHALDRMNTRLQEHNRAKLDE